jgi:hypothetical protein
METGHSIMSDLFHPFGVASGMCLLGPRVLVDCATMTSSAAGIVDPEGVQ